VSLKKAGRQNHNQGYFSLVFIRKVHAEKCAKRRDEEIAPNKVAHLVSSLSKGGSADTHSATSSECIIKSVRDGRISLLETDFVKDKMLPRGL
jgi:hypothetical protein